MSRGRKLDSVPAYVKALNNKYGMGEGEHYKPWLSGIDFGSLGISSKMPGLKQTRVHETFSNLETTFFCLADFCDSIIDIREQFPLLPLTLTMSIADSIGVKYPKIHNKVPVVMTTDFVLTRTDGQKIWYEAVQVKPGDELVDERTASKMDIERIFWQAQGIKYHIFIASQEAIQQSSNIQWFTKGYRRGKRYPCEMLAAALMACDTGLIPLVDICNRISDILKVDDLTALEVFKELLTCKYVLMDLNFPVERKHEIKITHVTDISEVIKNAS